MKIKKLFIQLFFIAGLLVTTFTACDKIEDTSGDGQSAGELKDIDGNVYQTVKFGSQVWMAENLKTTRYNDGTAIANVTIDTVWKNLTTGAYCNYENLESNAATYGRLYNWYAVNTGKLAPTGWHVPTDDEWTILENYLIAHGYNYDGTKDQNKIAKSLASSTGWDSTYSVIGSPGKSPEENNSTGFNALPCGIRMGSGEYWGIGITSDWWSSTDFFSNTALYWSVGCTLEYLYTYRQFKEYGLAIRFVKD